MVPVFRAGRGDVRAPASSRSMTPSTRRRDAGGFGTGDQAGARFTQNFWPRYLICIAMIAGGVTSAVLGHLADLS